MIPPRLPVLLYVLCLALVWPAALVRGDDAPPDYRIALVLDDAGGVQVTATLPAPRGAVRPPAADWITDTRIETAQGTTPFDAPVSRAVHRGQPVTVTLTGQLPPVGEAMAEAGFDPAGSFLVGDGWLARDAGRSHRFDIRVTAPAGQVVAGTGRLRAAGDARTTAFTFTGPGRDLAFFIGPYTVAERRHEGLILRTYFEAEDADQAERYLDATARYIDRYTDRIGPYPYAGYSVVSARLPVGLGFAGLTYVSRDILHHPYMTGRSLAHEVLHAWWGNAVAVDYARGNWAEGLTTFMADYALAEEAGPDAARAMRIDWLRALSALDPDAAKPVVDFRSAMHAGGQEEGYGKVAMIFVMLRDELGQAGFDAGIRRFYAENAGQIAAWDDLRTAFEDAAGRDLGWFFDQWLTRPGLASLDLRAAAPAPGGVSVSVGQEGAPYRLRVPLRIETEDGDEDASLRLGGGGTMAAVPTGAPARSVTLDPDFRLARHPGATELAPVLSDVMARGAGAVWLGPGAAPEDVQRALRPLTGADAEWQTGLQAAPDSGPLLLAGGAEAVAQARATLLPGAAPGPADATLWVERDGAGRLIAFARIAPDASLAGALRTLPFYGGAGMLVVTGDRITRSGASPTEGQPITLPVDPPAAR